MRAISGIVLLLFVLCGSPIPAAGSEFRSRASVAGKADVFTAEDVAEEVAFGREVAARVLGRLPLFDNTVLTRYVNLVGRTVARNANRPEIEFRFAVVDSSEVNAYSAPGGYVMITKAAVLAARDEAELAAVLAHEIAHITERHIVRELNIHATEDSPAAGFARLIGGGTEAAKTVFSQAVGKALDILFKNGYSREDEIRSDRAGIMLCLLTGYDPSALRRYLDRLQAGKGVDGAGKTHPVFDERLARIDNTIAAEKTDPARLASNRERFESILIKAKLL